MTSDDQRAAVECMVNAVADRVIERGDGAPVPRAVLLTIIRRDLNAAFRALLDAGWSVSRWQPSETWDGEDGVEVDLWAKGRRYADCHYHLGQWLYWCYAGVDQEPYWATVESPTHWMPLPEPPK